MKPRPATSPVRRFLRGLANTALYLLLPCQLALLWFVSREGPLELPGMVAQSLEERCAEAGGRLHARRYLLTPQRTLVAEDVTLEVAGLPGEVFTAARIEAGLRLTGPNRGLTSLRITEGRIWCPPSAAGRGERTLLLDRLHGELLREGRWWQARLLMRAGKFNLDFTGTLPVGLATAPPNPPPAGPSRPPAETLRTALHEAEQWLNWSARSGGGSVHLVGTGRADGGVDLRAEGILGDDWLDERLGVVRLGAPRCSAQLRLDAQGRPGDWTIEAEARDLESQGRGARRIALTASGRGLDAAAWRAVARATDIQGLGLPAADLRLEAFGDERAPWRAQVRTAASAADLSWRRLPDGTSEVRCPRATLSLEELKGIPAFRTGLADAGLTLDGALLLADAEVRCAPETWAVRSAGGRVAFGGLHALGLDAAGIAPGAGASLNADFRYEATAADYPLTLTRLDLAGVRGEAHCSLRAAGPFRLNLRGPIAPPSLDTLLGPWWVQLWSLFGLSERPHAVIEVEGAWGRPLSTTTRGAVTLADFRFMQAPFRSVAVRIDADAHRTWIGLGRLAGGSTEADGAVDGTVTWDWSKPIALAGPNVQVTGNLQPWVAATIAGPELGNSLRALALPATRRLRVEVTPGADAQPVVVAKVQCAAPFQAWGVDSAHLELGLRSAGPRLMVEGDLDLADGRAHLELSGDLLRAPRVKLDLTGADFAKVSALAGKLTKAPAAAPPPAPRTSLARLDLRFDGSVDLAQPILLRGQGSFLLRDPELKKVRVLGGLSKVLETIGVGATSYELQKAQGRYGCLGGKVYFPDLVLTGEGARLELAGEVDLEGATLNFIGDFSLPPDGSPNPLQWLNLNRAFVALTKIRVKGPLADPSTTALPRLKDLLKSNENKDLGAIPPALSE
jgi:hypothetical protein